MGSRHITIPIKKKQLIISISTFVLLLIVFFIALHIGRAGLTYKETVNAIFGRGDKSNINVIYRDRLPKIVLGILVGIGMGIAGAIMQDIMHNSLASPGTLGVSSGASVFVTIYMFISGFVLMNKGHSKSAVDIFTTIGLPLAALIGGLLSAIIIFLLSRKKKEYFSGTRIIMIGVAVSSLYAALSMFLVNVLDENRIELVQRWQSGELWGTEWKYIIILTIWLALSIFFVYRESMTLNVIKLNYETAKALGVNIEKKFFFFAAMSVVISSGVVAFGGNFFFLGLIGPHMARKMVGTDSRVLIPTTGAVSSIIVVVANAFGSGLKFLANVPVGIIISIFSVPYFIYLLLRKGED